MLIVNCFCKSLERLTVLSGQLAADGRVDDVVDEGEGHDVRGAGYTTWPYPPATHTLQILS